MGADGRLDVVVVGAGPGGSTTGHLLAAEGHSVLILDKEDFPRFHIGESLLPCDLPLFERLSMDMHDGPFLHKQGAEFIDEQTRDFAFYDFDDALPSGPRYAYQVERASFDHKLLQLAQRAGARVELRSKVREIATDDHGVTITTDRGTHRARFVVDATGQDALLGRRDKTIEPLRGLGRGAVFTHFEGLSEAVWAEIIPKGNIKVLIRPDGWVWMIPLPHRRVSLGFVSHVRGLELETLDEVIAESPLLRRFTAGATRAQTRIARNFSYRNRAPIASRIACVGDAACFLDPVFSSGVSLAMLGGERLAGELSVALHAQREADPAALAGMQQHMQHAYQSFGALVYSFYNTGLVRNIFFAPSPVPELRSGLISLLAGDLWRTDNRFQHMIMRSSRRQLGDVL